MEHGSGNGSDAFEPTGSPADEPTAPDLTHLATDGTSRRNFLKAAVVASAAVAAAGGAAGVALVSGHQPQSLIRFIGNANSGDPCDACIEGTAYTSNPYYYCTANNNNNPPTFLGTTTPPTTSNATASCASGTLPAGFTMNKNGTNNADFQIFFVDHAPAAGHINLTITVTGQSQDGAVVDNNADIDSSKLFTYNTGNGNAVWVTEQTNIPAAPCMSDQSSNLATFVRELGTSPASTLAGTGMGTAGGFSYTPLSSTHDVLVQLHMSWNGGKISNTANTTQLYTFKFTWTDGTTTCTKYLYIYGQQSANT